MIDKDRQSSLIKEHRDLSVRFVYYILALCVTAIGFTIVLTKDSALSNIHIFYGIAIVLWGASIHSGLRYLNKMNISIHLNLEMFKMENSNNPYISKDFNTTANKMGRLFNYQQYFLYSGILFYLIGHIWQMYCNSQI